MSRVVALSEDLVRHVAERMRASDRAEIGAMSWPAAAPADLAREACTRSRYGAVVLDDAGRPAVALGAVETWPGTFSVWLFATDAWAGCWRAAVRWLRQHLRPTLRGLGGGCAFVFAADGRAEVERMLRGLGFVRRGVVPQFGAGGERFALWSIAEARG